MRESWHACVVAAGVNPSGKTMMCVLAIYLKEKQKSKIKILISHCKPIEAIVDNNQGIFLRLELQNHHKCDYAIYLEKNVYLTRR